jgi:hypothetical protein
MMVDYLLLNIYRLRIMILLPCDHAGLHFHGHLSFLLSNEYVVWACGQFVVSLAISHHFALSNVVDSEQENTLKGP